MEYYDGINLWSPKEFQLWFHDQRQSESIESITNRLLNLNSAIGNCRAVCTCYFGNDYDRFAELVTQLLYTDDNLIEYYGRAMRLATKPALDRARKTDNAVEGTVNTEAMLRDLLQEIGKEKKSPFQREVECMARLAYAVSLRVNGNFAEAEANAARALDYAQILEAAITVSEARFELVSIRYREGRIAATVQELQQEPGLDIRTPFRKALDDSVTAYCFAHLGNFVEGLDLLYKLHADPQNATAKGNFKFIQVYIQELQCLIGADDLTVPSIPGMNAQVTNWFVDICRKLIEAKGTERTVRKLPVRDGLLNKAIELANGVNYNLANYYAVMKVWFLAVARLWRGEAGIAYRTSFDIPYELKKEWFSTRMLFAGLRLEASLHVSSYDLPVLVHEGELKQIFFEARQVKHTSVRGLADQMMYWFPLASAYCANIDDGIAELAEINDALLNTNTNTVYDLKLPVTLSTELMLRSLDLDHYGKLKSIDHGKRRNVRNDLLTKRGAALYVKPVLAPTSLIFGYMKAGRHSHEDYARKIANQFGLAPKVPAHSDLRRVCEGLEKATHQLLNKEINAKSFSTTVTEL